MTTTHDPNGGLAARTATTLTALRDNPDATPDERARAASALKLLAELLPDPHDTDADEEFDAVGRRRTPTPTKGRDLTTGMTLSATGERITDIGKSIREPGRLIVAATRNGATTAFTVDPDELVNVDVWSVEQA